MSTECLSGPLGCEGEVSFHLTASGTRSFPRCEKHFAEYLEECQSIALRYPHNAPTDFDPAYAGERWDDDY